MSHLTTSVPDQPMLRVLSTDPPQGIPRPVKPTRGRRRATRAGLWAAVTLPAVFFLGPTAAVVIVGGVLAAITWPWRTAGIAAVILSAAAGARAGAQAKAAGR